MNKFILIFFTLLPFLSICQITIDSSNIASLGEVRYFGNVENDADLFSIGNAGTNETWDFSNLIAEEQDSIFFSNPQIFSVLLKFWKYIISSPFKIDFKLTFLSEVVFFTMLYWIIVYAGIISNRFSSLTLIGFASILFIHLAVNMGMTVGLLPVTGLPAPFLSYGGSFLLSCMLILALSTNIINHHI